MSFCYVHRAKKCHPIRCLLPTLYLRQLNSDMPASEPFISKGTVERTSNCEFLRKIYHFPSFWKSLSSTKLTYTPTLSPIYALTISIGNTLPFVSQSINNFSDYGISQSADWECPSLSPHVLLTRTQQFLKLVVSTLLQKN